jgi:hypothetical protein
MNRKSGLLLFGEASFLWVEVGWGQSGLILTLTKPDLILVPLFGSLASYGVVSIFERIRRG